MSHLVKYAGETGQLPVDSANFSIIGSRYHNNAHHMKIAETFLVKKLKYSRKPLNIQEILVPLKLLTRHHYVTLCHIGQTFNNFKYFLL